MNVIEDEDDADAHKTVTPFIRLLWMNVLQLQM